MLLLIFILLLAQVVPVGGSRIINVGVIGVIGIRIVVVILLITIGTVVGFLASMIITVIGTQAIGCVGNRIQVVTGSVSVVQ